MLSRTCSLMRTSAVRSLIVAMLMLAAAGWAVGCAWPSAEPTPHAIRGAVTHTPSPTSAPAPLRTPSPPSVPTATPTPLPTAVPAATPTRTRTPTPTPTATPTPTPPPPPTAIPTPSPTFVPLPFPTHEPFPTALPTARPVGTPLPWGMNPHPGPVPDGYSTQGGSHTGFLDWASGGRRWHLAPTRRSAQWTPTAPRFPT